jgi:hypothetical protein
MEEAGEPKTSERLKLLASINDPNEYIKAHRAMTAEDAETSEEELFPFPKSAQKIPIEGYIGTWLDICAVLPITSKEQVSGLIEELIAGLREVQNNLPADVDTLKGEVLRFLRRGIDAYRINGLGN